MSNYGKNCHRLVAYSRRILLKSMGGVIVDNGCYSIQDGSEFREVDFGGVPLYNLCGEDKFAVFIARKVFTAGVEFLSLYFYALNPRFKEVLNAGLATCTLFGGFDEV